MATPSTADTTHALIVTADDFGRSREVNAAVARAHRDGILTAASLMVAGSASAEAAAIARDHPNLDVGLHVTVCLGRSILPPARLLGLVDPNGDFSASPVAAGMRYFFKSDTRALLREELRAQIDRHLELIGHLSHLDGHLNFHVHPTVAGILLELCTEYRIPCMRLPREPVLTTLSLARDHALRKLTEALIFRALSRRSKRMMSERGILTTDRLFGLHQSGHFTEPYVFGVIERLPRGLTEIYFHPAIDVGATPPDLSTQRDFAILTNPSIRAALDSHAIRLTNFAELSRQRTITKTQ
ncbi:MAG TPA: hopanoid biosynthesis-associated protein HpnK [Candidatus Binataceae bacterium]|nr:hopanoid biosynthesis-associated protein HpnK [Candidatus Binataceae bacterium]